MDIFFLKEGGETENGSSLEFPSRARNLKMRLAERKEEICKFIEGKPVRERREMELLLTVRTKRSLTRETRSNFIRISAQSPFVIIMLLLPLLHTI